MLVLHEEGARGGVATVGAPDARVFVHVNKPYTQKKKKRRGEERGEGVGKKGAEGADGLVMGWLSGLVFSVAQEPPGQVTINSNGQTLFICRVELLSVSFSQCVPPWGRVLLYAN